MSMEPKPPNAASNDAGEDRLSALPDDVLVLILLRLDTEDAARTSVLSSRWRHVWTLVPELRFFDYQSHCTSSALSAGEVPLRYLLVDDQDASPQSLSAWLPAAARRVTGKLVLLNFASEGRGTEDEEAEASQSSTLELPCFQKATTIMLFLRFLGLSVPPAGVFARLTDLVLSEVRFHGPGDLGDAVSSPRCPCLQSLTIGYLQGLDSITIDSKSLQLLKLDSIPGVRQVIVVAPTLKDFTLWQSFIYDQNQPVVNISAPQLKSLLWNDAYDPSSVDLGSMECLRTLCTFFSVYGLHGTTHNHACLMLLPRFKAIKYLDLSFSYPTEVDDFDVEYLMQNVTMLPDVTSLQLCEGKWTFLRSLLLPCSQDLFRYKKTGAGFIF